VATALKARYPHIVGTWHTRKPDRAAAGHCLQYDLLTDDADQLMAAASPDVVVHCAALSSRVECEAEPAFARRVNVEATRRLAEACAERNAVLIYISTDLVFDGKEAPYNENDPVSPASVYAETKVEAEAAVLEACPQSYILRTALMYGITADDTPGSFLSWNVGTPRRGEAVQLYSNQFRMPLYAPDVAHVITGLLAVRPPYGIYHCAGPERLSRFEIGMEIAQHFELRTELMEETSLDEIDDTSLVTSKVVAVTGVQFTSLETGLTEIAPRIVFK
jgi:dTDP-4-dehydrorhamnose reductase